eukprot:Gregarina_sp_Pseudo_9__2758@NODE_29_length_5572_cov_164_494488_g27_i0_p2_GENE_NODE_29_length_5572_cov_164_494488_g27_i0NODE_29_length_5572_cov_164_494488_g27_i0_p2_ORF_typecomplete_len342_score89_64META/PF03724_16/0_035_NODE_29_length_5572_cov_164_494488_g27_i035144539
MPEISKEVAAIRVPATKVQHGETVWVDCTKDHACLLQDPLYTNCSHTTAALQAYCVVESASNANVLLEGVRCLATDKTNIRQWRFVGLPEGAGEFGCGISCPELFGSGQQVEGLLLMANGALTGQSSGSRVSGFASEEVWVDWIIRTHGLVVDVYLVVNDAPCGQAFHLKFAAESSMHKLRPVICFQGARREVAFFDYDVSEISTSVTQPPDPTLPADCVWTPLPKSFEGVVFPPQDSVTLECTSHGCGVRVFNTIRSPASFEPDGSIQCVGPVAASLMSPPSPFDHTERVMTEMLESMQSWEITHPENHLHILCPNKVTRIFEMNKGIKNPVLENPFFDV